MYPIITHLYGPFSINSYGTAILVGVLLFIFLTFHNKIRHLLLTDNQFYDLIFYNFFGALLGGRLLFTISEWSNITSWTEFFLFWDGGFSILGTMMGVMTVTYFYLIFHKIPPLKVFDLIVLNASLIQAFGRLGCFFAGCCYGIPSSNWGMMFTHPAGLAPLCVKLLPIQLISAALYILIFGIMHHIKYKVRKDGQLTMIYLILSSTERFALDFFRADRIMMQGFPMSLLSLHQWIALFLIIIGIVNLLIITLRPRIHL